MSLPPRLAWLVGVAVAPLGLLLATPAVAGADCVSPAYTTAVSGTPALVGFYSASAAATGTTEAVLVSSAPAGSVLLVEAGCTSCSSAAVKYVSDPAGDVVGQVSASLTVGGGAVTYAEIPVVSAITSGYVTAGWSSTEPNRNIQVSVFTGVETANPGNWVTLAAGGSGSVSQYSGTVGSVDQLGLYFACDDVNLGGIAAGPAGWSSAGTPSATNTGCWYYYGQGLLSPDFLASAASADATGLVLLPVPPGSGQAVTTASCQTVAVQGMSDTDLSVAMALFALLVGSLCTRAWLTR